MAREDHNVIPVDSYGRLSSVTEQILERSCESEKRQCNGEVAADGLNHYFECATDFCDWKFSLKSDHCVKVYGSRFNVKPNDTNKEWFKEGKRIEFSYGYEDCRSKLPFHVSVVPCEEDGDYEASYNITEIPCGMADFTFDIDFTQAVLKMHEKVTFQKGVFTDPHCEASHGRKVVYTIGKNGTQRLPLPDSIERATCDGDECQSEVNVGGQQVNQGAKAYLWAWYDGWVGDVSKAKVAGPFKILFCSIEGAMETQPLLEYSLTDTNKIVFKKWRYNTPECESAHGSKLKYQLSRSGTNITDVPWAEQWASCDTYECHFQVTNMTNFTDDKLHIWAHFDGKRSLAYAKPSGVFDVYRCTIAQAISSIDFEAAYLTPKEMFVSFQKWKFDSERCDRQHGDKLKYAISSNSTQRQPVPHVAEFARCPNSTCYFDVRNSVKGQPAYIWAYFDGTLDLANGKPSDMFEIFRCNGANTFGEKFAHTKEVAVPIDDLDAMTLKVSPSYVLDTVESVTLKSFRRVIGYDTFESIRTLKRHKKKDTSDYYNITMSIVTRRKSMDQCKGKAAKEKEIKAGGPGKIGGTLDKGFPYDDGDVTASANTVKRSAQAYQNFTAVPILSQVEPGLAEQYQRLLTDYGLTQTVVEDINLGASPAHINETKAAGAPLVSVSKPDPQVKQSSRK